MELCEPARIQINQNLEEEQQFDDKQDQLISMFLREGAPKLVRLIAGPGTGKTKTILGILQKMYFRQERPLYQNFLVLTFTRQTRLDLMKKISQLKGYSQQKKDHTFYRVRNFHSLAYGVLFWKRVIDEKQQKTVFNEILQQLIQISHQRSPNKYEKKQIVNQAWAIFHRILAEGISDQQIQIRFDRIKENRRMTWVYGILDKYKNWLDDKFNNYKETTFDYAILKATEFMKQGEECFGIDIQKLDLIIVDQFQDCTPAQIKMIETLMTRSKKDPRVVLIGDYDQSIYNFRGTDLAYIQDFISKYEGKQLYLNNTYRLCKSVLDVSQELIKTNLKYKGFRQKFYRDYRLQSKSTRGDYPIVVQQFGTQYSEVRWVVQKIYDHVKKEGKASDIAILCRQFKNTTFSQKLRLELKRQCQLTGIEIKYEFDEGKSPMQSKQALELLAWMRYLYKIQKIKRRKADTDDVKRILKLNHINNDPVRNKMIDEKRIQLNFGGQIYPGNKRLKENSWNAFFQSYRIIREIFFSKYQITEALRKIKQNLLGSTWFKKQDKQQFLEESFDEFIDAVLEIAKTVDRQKRQKEPTISVLQKIFGTSQEDQRNEQMQNEQNNHGLRRKSSKDNSKSMIHKKRLLLIQQLQLGIPKKKMQILTCHKSKGLQFPLVFICGLDFQYFQSDFEDAMLPPTKVNGRMEEQQQRNIDMMQKDSEQLRLIYTAITRTSGQVYITASRRCFLKWTQSAPYPPHTIFQKLKQLCPGNELIEFNEVADMGCKIYIDKEVQRLKQLSAKKEERKKERERNQRNGQ